MTAGRADLAYACRHRSVALLRIALPLSFVCAICARRRCPDVQRLPGNKYIIRTTAITCTKNNTSLVLSEQRWSTSDTLQWKGAHRRGEISTGIFNHLLLPSIIWCKTFVIPCTFTLSKRCFKTADPTLSISLILFVFFLTPDCSSSSSSSSSSSRSLSEVALLSATTRCLLVPDENNALLDISPLSPPMLDLTGRLLVELALESLDWLESEPESESELSLPL